MTTDEIIKELVLRANTDCNIYFEYCEAIALILPKRLREQLTQLVNGPVWDGDIISKSNRADLFDLGLAIRVCCKGQQGYTGAPYIAAAIANHWKEKQSLFNA